MFGQRQRRQVIMDPALVNVSWLIRSDCGSKFKGTAFESPPGQTWEIDWDCANSMLHVVQGHGSVHYEESFKSFDKSRA